MPTYDYRCEACGHAFEEYHSMAAKPLRKCPECGRLRLRRLFGTGAGIIFKGSGFYETDYRRKSSTGSKTADADGGGGSKTDTSGDGVAKEPAAKEPAAKDPATKPAPSAKAGGGGGRKKSR